MTITDQFSVFVTLEDPVEFWDAFKRETLESANECTGREEGLPHEKCWKVSRRVAPPGLLGTVTNTELYHVRLELS